MENDLEKLEKKIQRELFAIIRDAEANYSGAIKDMQPPLTIIEAMAKAAAQVLIAFERGYRMDGES